MSKQTKAEIDDQEAEAESQEDIEAHIEDELNRIDEQVDFLGLYGWGFLGHVGGIDYDDYAQWLGAYYPQSTVKNEADVSGSDEDWSEFLKKVEEDLEK